MNCFNTALAASLLAVTAAGASADFPKSGSTKGTTYLIETFVDELDGWQAEWQPYIAVSVGVIRDQKDGGPFDKNFLRCVGQAAMVAGKSSLSGTCTETDKDGDQIFISYGAGEFTYAGGTGKYKGITGGGTNKVETIHDGKKNWAGILSSEKHWEIK
jgi:hypothetical protein